MLNLAEQPEFAGKLEELSGALTEWQVEQRDAGLIPEPMLTELDEQGLIRDYVVSENYPVEEIVKLAQAAGARDAAMLDIFLKQLQSGHPVKSYWAATGLLLLGDGAQPALPVIESALEQVEPWTGVVLAEILIGLDRLSPATQYLEEMRSSIAAMTSSSETKLISTSSCVNSGCRSARRSSSRKQRTI